MVAFVFFFKQKTAYEMRISDWSSDVCSSDLSSVRTGSLNNMAMCRRTRHWLLAGLATVALAIPALGQNAPESLLPPGFGEPVPAEAPRPQQPGPVRVPSRSQRPIRQLRSRDRKHVV